VFSKAKSIGGGQDRGNAASAIRECDRNRSCGAQNIGDYNGFSGKIGERKEIRRENDINRRRHN
jgi:hypothetical protein